jgi:hypothetical protein
MTWRDYLSVLAPFVGAAVAFGLHRVLSRRTLKEVDSTLTVWRAADREHHLNATKARMRVCEWCGKTDVPDHVRGIVNVKGTTSTWYCSNRCFRSGAGYEEA